MTPDCDEIDRLVDWAEASHIAGDGEWNQVNFATVTDCGTAYCIAGKWAIERGWRYNPWFGWLSPSAEFAHPVFAASEGLGLTTSQAYGSYDTPGLFFAGNTIDDLRRIAKEIRTEAGQ